MPTLNGGGLASNKVLVELDVIYTYDNGGKGTVASFTHPQLKGNLFLEASSTNLAEVLVSHIDLNKPVSTDPIQELLSSANKLVAGVNSLKETFNKS